MRKPEKKSWFIILLIVAFIAVLFQTSVFAAEPCNWCNVSACTCIPHDLTKAIPDNYEKYILQIVRKTGEVPEQIHNKIDDKTLEVIIPVEANENDLLRGVQISLSKMNKIKLAFFDDKEYINTYTLYKKDSGMWSMPTYGNKVVIEVKPYDKKNKPEFGISTIKYNKVLKHQHRTTKTVEYLNIKGEAFKREAGNFKSYIDRLNNSTITSLNLRESEDSSDHENCKSDVLYQVLHGSLTDLAFNPEKLLKDMVSQSLADWIIQKSCLVVNTNTAGNWCKYLTSYSRHKTKGVFGYSVVTYAGSTKSAPYTEYFVKSSQTKPMLDSYLGSSAQTASDKDGIIYNNAVQESYAYATAIVNEYNIKDSMFTLSDTPSNSKYRYYRLSKTIDDASCEFDFNSFHGGLKTELRGGKTFLVLQYEDSNLNHSIEIGVNPGGMNDETYVLKYLNDLTPDQFDAKFTGVFTLPKEVMDIRTSNPKAYKKYAMHYIYTRYNSSRAAYFAVQKPKVLLEKFGDKYVAEYAELEAKTDGVYGFITDISGKVIWKKEVLRGYNNKKEEGGASQ